MTKKELKKNNFQSPSDLDKALGYEKMQSAGTTMEDLFLMVNSYRAACCAYFSALTRLSRENQDYQIDVTRLNQLNRTMNKTDAEKDETIKALKSDLESAMELIRLNNLSFSASQSERFLTGKGPVDELKEETPETRSTKSGTNPPEQQKPAPGTSDSDNGTHQKQTFSNTDPALQTSPAGTRPDQNAQPGSEKQPEAAPAEKKAAPQAGIPKTQMFRNSEVKEEEDRMECFPDNFFEEHPNYVRCSDTTWTSFEYVQGYLKKVTHHLQQARKISGAAVKESRKPDPAPSGTKKERTDSTDTNGVQTDIPKPIDLNQQDQQPQSAIEEGDTLSEGSGCMTSGTTNPENGISNDLEEQQSTDSDEHPFDPLSFISRFNDLDIKVGEIIPACPVCGPIFHKSEVGATLVAHIIYSKHHMYTPYNRLAAKFEIYGIHISKQLIGQWMKKASDLLKPVYWVMKHDLKTITSLQADGTPALCLEHLKKYGRKKCYFVQFLSGPKEDLQMQFYIFRSNRSQVFIQDVLDEFRMYCLQTDGFPGYMGWEFIINFGCFDHLRRPFSQALLGSAVFEEYKVILIRYGLNSPEMDEFLNRPGNGLVKDTVLILDGFSVIYHNDRICEHQNFTAEETQRYRKQYSEPILDKVYEIIEGYTTKTDKNGKPLDGKKYISKDRKFGKGVVYAMNQKQNMYRHMEDGRFNLGNYRCEQGQKPLKLIENNSMFYSSAAGAAQTAEFLSYGCTCEMNGVDAEAWYAFALTNMKVIDVSPFAKRYEDLNEEDVEQIRKILPYSKELPESLKLPEPIKKTKPVKEIPVRPELRQPF